MEILTKRQTAFLEYFGASNLSKQFYLTGGTALAGFYLPYRYSEDLDFFSEQEFDPSAVQAMLAQMRPKLGFTSVDSQQSFNRNLYFLKFSDSEVLKTEFTFFPFARIEKGLQKNGVSIDSVFDIAVNKLFTIYQRVKARDYIDLYCLCKEKNYSIADLVKQAKVKFDWHVDPLQLASQFLRAADAKDYPRLIAPLEPRVWKDFFGEEAQKLKGEIAG